MIELQEKDGKWFTEDGRRVGNQNPAHRVANDRAVSAIDSAEVQDFMRKAGKPFVLFLWQLRILRDLLALDTTQTKRYGKPIWFYKKAGLTLPRRQGKTRLIIVLMFIRCILFKEEIFFTTYRDDLVEKFIRKEVIGEFLNKSPFLLRYFPQLEALPKQKRKLPVNNQMLQAYSPTTGEKLGSINFGTRAGGVGRGDDLHMVIFDEAQHLTTTELAAIEPALSANEALQGIFLGTAVSMIDAGEPGSRGVKTAKRTTFMDIRAQLRGGELRRGYWVEWGVDKLVPKNDREYWFAANPSLNLGGQTEENLESSLLSEETFATEHLGYWPTQAKSRVIDITRWRDLRQDTLPEVTPRTLFSVAVKFNLSGTRADICIAFRTEDNINFLQMSESYLLDEDWQEDLTNEVLEYLKTPGCVGVWVDGPYAESLLMELKNRGYWNAAVPVKRRQGLIVWCGPSDMAGSAQQLISAANEKKIRYFTNTRLETAVEDSKKREFRNGGFGFESISGKTDVNYMEVAAIANYALSQKVFNRGDIDNSQQKASSWAKDQSQGWR